MIQQKLYKTLPLTKKKKVKPIFKPNKTVRIKSQFHSNILSSLKFWQALKFLNKRRKASWNKDVSILIEVVENLLQID